MNNVFDFAKEFEALAKTDEAEKAKDIPFESLGVKKKDASGKEIIEIELAPGCWGGSNVKDLGDLLRKKYMDLNSSYDKNQLK